jgi:hypothetical protein
VQRHPFSRPCVPSPPLLAKFLMASSQSAIPRHAVPSIHAQVDVRVGLHRVVFWASLWLISSSAYFPACHALLKRLKLFIFKVAHCPAELRGDLKRLKRDRDSSPSPVAAATDSSRKIPKPRRRRLYLVVAAALASIALAIAGFLLRRPFPPPRVLGTTQLTDDRRPKFPPFLTDGSRIYFSTGTDFDFEPYQVSAQGGESLSLPIQLRDPHLQDISADHSELLVRTNAGHGVPSASVLMPLWLAPITGGSPRRVGNLSWLRCRVVSGRPASDLHNGKGARYRPERWKRSAEVDRSSRCALFATLVS